MQTSTLTMNEQMRPILEAVDLLLFTPPKTKGDPRDTWQANLWPLMEEVKEKVGDSDMLLVYQIATNQALRTVLDPRFRKIIKAHQRKEKED